ncbi:conserved membrane protein of unknown function [Acidithiobacillus ferrivorans]|uniref:Uncharacterized protein n=1 Tax=Acidithiobacillus ferrivorans TaxID=160808 RepID=A0A060URA1_9PROT|nr:hypothetical protein [Acidithiobacillus ferrivorans]CDQ10831.1 conserved membrane hypothetical protein [Acidithiobacillus ferrivorans]SMH65971.1 conserved membrane protein of unknown function [Acidithiobacillus ferrivorans]
MAEPRDWLQWLHELINGVGMVLLVLLAVLVLLTVDGLLLIPGLIIAYGVTGIAWQWQGFIPDPQVPPGPWMSMAVGLITALVPAIIDGVMLHFLLRDKGRGTPKSSS